MRAPVRHRLVRLLAALGLVGALLLPAAALPLRAAEDDPVVIRVGTTQDLDSLNPYATLLVSGYEVYQLTYNLLVDFGPNLEPVPGFAESWERAEDGTSWTFTFRDDLKWSDGTPATSADACFSWQLNIDAVAAEASVGAGYIDPGITDAGVTKVECPDETTMIAYTEDASQRILQTYIPILPKHIWGAKTYAEIGEAVFEAPLVGTGPYIVQEWQTSQFVRLERNPEYWGTQGAADEVVIQFFKSDDTMISALKAGEIDYARGPNADQLKALENEPDIEIVAGSANGWTQLAFNGYGASDGKTIPDGGPSTKALLDPAFRDALGYAIDKDLLVERVLGGFGDVGTTVIPPVIAKWHVEPTTPRTFDIEVAKQKLDAAGYRLDASGARLDKDGNPISLRLYFPDSDALYKDSAEFVRAWYEQLGLRVTAQAFDSTTLGNVILPPEACEEPDCPEYKADYDIELWGWAWGPDPNNALQVFLCEAIGSSSDSQYCNPEFDELYAQQAAAQTDEERLAILTEMQNILYDDAVYDILFYDANLAAYRTDRFGGWQNQPLDNGTPFFTYSTLQYTMLTSTGGGDTTMVALAALGGGVIVVAGIALAVVFRRRSRGGLAEEEE